MFHSLALYFIELSIEQSTDWVQFEEKFEPRIHFLLFSNQLVRHFDGELAFLAVLGSVFILANIN